MVQVAHVVVEQKKSDTETFIKKSTYVHNGYFSYNDLKYLGSNKYVYPTCPLHGKFQVKANNHLNGTNCPKCSKLGIKHKITKLEKVNKSTKKLTTETFVKKVIEKYNDEWILDKVEYINNKTGVLIGCKKHGYFLITPNHLLSGEGCPYCAGNKQLTFDEVVKRSKIVHGDKYFYDKNKNNEYLPIHKDMICTCFKHGDFKQTPANHLRGQGCSACNISHLEETIELLLKNNGIKYIWHVKKKDGLKWIGKQELDFYLPDQKIAIECQGIQHYKPTKLNGISIEEAEKNFKIQQRRDKIKLKKCNENFVLLLYFTNVKNDVYENNTFYDENLLLEKIKSVYLDNNLIKK